MDLSVIIVNWNSVDYLRKCLTTLPAGTPGLSCEVIVIDAASFDGSEKMLREEFPNVRFIQSQKNLGFARANNEACKAATGRCVLFLNPDTEIVGPAIRVMHDQLMNLPEAGAVGCKLLNSDRTIQMSCIQSVPTILNQVLDSEYLRARWPRSALWGVAPIYEADGKARVVEAISGACLMLKREVFEKVGRFSEDYFMYGEDIDLCYKVDRAGYRNYYVPAATVIHFGGGSSQGAASNFSFVMTRESIWRFLRKTRGHVYGLGYRASMLGSAFVRLAFLMALFPVDRARRRGPSWNTSFNKWRAILRWSINREASVSKYQ